MAKTAASWFLPPQFLNGRNNTVWLGLNEHECRGNLQFWPTWVQTMLLCSLQKSETSTWALPGAQVHAGLLSDLLRLGSTCLSNFNQRGRIFQIHCKMALLKWQSSWAQPLLQTNNIKKLIANGDHLRTLLEKVINFYGQKCWLQCLTSTFTFEFMTRKTLSYAVTYLC